MWGAIAGAVIGGMMSQNAADDAARAQQGAADRASASSERIFDKQVELQRPFREAGVSGLNRLSYLLGLSPELDKVSRDQIRRELVGQYTTKGTPDTYGMGHDGQPAELIKGRPDYIDEPALNAAIDRQFALQSQRVSDMQADPEYGSLLRDFSMADFEADPGYAFRQAEGLKGIESGAAARGGLLSGAALKAIQKYGQDLASQEYGNAYGRFTANQTNKYNKLAGLVNTGQGASNTLSNAAGNLGSNLSSNIIGAGNAQAAGIVGGANAWNQAIGQGINAYQSNQLMDMIRRPATTNYGSSYVPGYGYGTSYGE